MTEDAFLTTNDVLKYLQVNLRTVYRLIQSNKIPVFRVGRQWRFRKKDIDDWLQSKNTPASKPTKLSSLRTPIPSSFKDKTRILLVDSDANTQKFLSESLIQKNYEVDIQQNGREALKRLQIVHYDLLITELNIPDMDGLSLIQKSRQLKNSVPVIVITNASTEASAIEAINLGVSGYFKKPVQSSIVLEISARVLDKEIET